MALVQKSFSDIITFSRSSNATRVGPTGLVEYAPHNLLQRSQEFDNAYWTKYQSTVTANSLAAPDGTVTADTLTANSTSSCFAYSTATSLAVTTYTLSAYCKAGTASFVALEVSDSVANACQKYFNLQNGTVGSTATVGSNVVFQSASIQSAGNGWYRCSATFRIASATNYTCPIYVTDADNSTNVTNGRNIYIWGAQLAVGPYALDYTPTTSAAVYGPRFDYDGSGVTIVEPVSRNLHLYSVYPAGGTGWSVDFATATANTVSAPDGTTTAATLVESGDNNFHITYPAAATGSASALTGSVFIKQGTRQYAAVQLYVDSAAKRYTVVVDLSNGSVTATTSLGSPTGTAYAVTSAGNGWYRISVTSTSSGTGTAGIAVGLSNSATPGTYSSALPSYPGNGSGSIYFWGAQLEVGSTATGYMVSGATNGFRAVPVVSGSATARGLLVEEQRTNLLTYSEQFDNAAWAKFNSSVSANSATSPDGTVTADAVTANTNNTQHLVNQTATDSNASATISCFVKANGYNFVALQINDNVANGAGAVFNLSTGAIVGDVTVGTWTVSSKTITAVGNGWYRCSATVSATGSTRKCEIEIRSTSALTWSPAFIGDGISGLFLWGAQLEAGSFATSYIPTLASTVTRSADVASVNTLSPWHNSVEGTLYAEGNFIAPTSSSSKGIATLVDNSAGNDSISIFGISSSNVKQEVLVGGASQASFTLGYSSNIKAATAYKANDTNAAVNGTTGTTDTSCTVPTVAKLQLGGIYNGTSFQLNGWLRRVAFYPRRLLDAEIQALTS